MMSEDIDYEDFVKKLTKADLFVLRHGDWSHRTANKQCWLDQEHISGISPKPLVETLVKIGTYSREKLSELFKMLCDEMVDVVELWYNNDPAKSSLLAITTEDHDYWLNLAPRVEETS